VPIVVYLEPSDYAAYGVAVGTDPAIVLRASLFVDGFLDRRDGLLYTESMGEPVYMTKTGLPIREIYDIPLSQHITLSYTPLVKVLSIKANNKFQYNAVYPNAPPNFVDITNFTFEAGYSDLWVGSAFPRTQAIIKYIGGWTYATLPSEIKQAVANIVNVMTGIAGGIISTGNVTKFQAGDTSISFGLGSSDNIESNLSFFIDKDTARLLMPWKRTFR
jgi:hypothetical protein